MTFHSLIFTLSAVGVAETAYLVRSRWRTERPVCVLGRNCHKVLESRYSRMFLIPNDLLGLFFYLSTGLLSALLVIEVAPVSPWLNVLKGSVALASAASLLFTYLQWRRIGAWCFWCLMSAVTIWLMGLIIVFI